ncbi:MAG TPA: NAD-dependent epimerase/dehydratase family protein [Xanthobacteraceae bacterium]|nr:NAD-dependent epimerase/dehydratase family protein [Xanthobacteraceae bacterium]
MSFLVLGGGGFMGTNLCLRLVAAGARVRAFGRSRAFPDELARVEWRQGDLADTAALASAIASCDVVFHLAQAATPQSANLDMAADLRDCIMPTLALLEVCRKANVKRVVFISSGGTVYGAAKEMPTPETASTDPITAYAIGKLTIEKFLGLYEHLHALSFRVLRVANPYGPFQLPAKAQGLVAMLLSRAIARRSTEIWGDGSVVRDYVFIDDVVDALLAAAVDDSSERIFNIGSGRGRSVREVIAAVEAELGAPVPIVWTPGRAIDVPVSVLSIERARSVLDWTPKTEFAEGLRRTVMWWRAREPMMAIGRNG